MKIPEGMTEEEVIDCIQRICRRLANTFRFSFYTREDIEQQGFIEGMKGLETYNGLHPLKNFLSTHIRNRLKNFKRDNYKRNDPPCKVCSNHIEGKTKHRNKRFCDKYLNWIKKNETRQNIINAINIDVINEDSQQDKKPVFDDVDSRELLDKIDANLPLDMRKDYLKLRDGLKIPKDRTIEIENKIKDILGADYGDG